MWTYIYPDARHTHKYTKLICTDYTKTKTVKRKGLIHKQNNRQTLTTTNKLYISVQEIFQKNLKENLFSFFCLWYSTSVQTNQVSSVSSLNSSFQTNQVSSVASVNSTVSQTNRVSSVASVNSTVSQTNRVSLVASVDGTISRQTGSVLLLHLTSLLAVMCRYWPVIDDALRSAAFDRQVTVRLLASQWAHTKKDMYAFLCSLSMMNNLHYPRTHIEVVRSHFVSLPFFCPPVCSCISLCLFVHACVCVCICVIVCAFV